MKFIDKCLTDTTWGVVVVGGGGGGGETSLMKGAGMLIIQLRGANFGFLVSLRVFWADHKYF